MPIMTGPGTKKDVFDIFECSEVNHINCPQEREGNCPGLCPSHGLYTLAVSPGALLWDNPNYRAFSSTSP